MASADPAAVAALQADLTAATTKVDDLTAQIAALLNPPAPVPVPEALTILDQTVDVTANTPATSAVTAAGGTAPLSFSSGDLPAGVGMDAAGNLSIPPTAAGTYTATVLVTDSATPPATASATLTITAA